MTIDEAIKESIKTGAEVTLPRSEDRMTAAAEISEMRYQYGAPDDSDWNAGVLTFSGQGWSIRSVPWDSEELEGDSARPGAVQYSVWIRESEEGWMGYVLAVSAPDACRRYASTCAWSAVDLCAVDDAAALALHYASTGPK